MSKKPSVIWLTTPVAKKGQEGSKEKKGSIYALKKPNASTLETPESDQQSNETSVSQVKTNKHKLVARIFSFHKFCNGLNVFSTVMVLFYLCLCVLAFLEVSQLRVLDCKEWLLLTSIDFSLGLFAWVAIYVYFTNLPMSETSASAVYNGEHHHPFLMELLLYLIIAVFDVALIGQFYSSYTDAQLKVFSTRYDDSPDSTLDVRMIIHWSSVMQFVLLSGITLFYSHFVSMSRHKYPRIDRVTNVGTV
jgi:hypothetical protein